MSVISEPTSTEDIANFKHGDARQDILATAEKPVFFKLRAQMLKQGRTNTPVCKTENMWGVVKVYASGGENGLHMHTKEDHMFVVMQGSARFYGPKEETHDVATHEGVLLPKGCYYRFHATSDEPLVLFRVGCHTEEAKDKAMPSRLALNGKPMPGNHPDNKQVEVIYRDGEFFE
jgi:mannose-6-phosphate isomerase-like protein (cupin superfamily)